LKRGEPEVAGQKRRRLKVKGKRNKKGKQSKRRKAQALYRTDDRRGFN